MAVHHEEGSFVVRIELSADFEEDYEGDDDGYAWLRVWHDRVRSRLARAIFAELRADGFEALAVSRGRNPEEELEIAVRFRGGAAPRL
jgi:hypothetical protein